jgi:hypothetical protein
MKKENEETNNEQLVEFKNITGTPFTAVRMEEKWMLTLGKYRMTEELETLEECIKASEEHDWMRIMAVMQVMMKENEELKQVIEEVKEIKNKINVSI